MARLTCKLSNQRMDVLGAPRRGRWAEFHWFGEFPACDARPPGGLAYWNNRGGIGFGVTEDMANPQESGFR